ncbi:MAG: hypothetical protein RID09_03300, partial [Coleofasciculus sp. G1-WW12-02]|uniref:hypothetical protein n=1 Tax=Coleofasciculus sp. G1-WW12-02 TaxID=3068483 RepID=UPI0032F1577F
SSKLAIASAGRSLTLADNVVRLALRLVSTALTYLAKAPCMRDRGCLRELHRRSDCPIITIIRDRSRRDVPVACFLGITVLEYRLWGLRSQSLLMLISRKLSCPLD